MLLARLPSTGNYPGSSADQCPKRTCYNLVKDEDSFKIRLQRADMVNAEGRLGHWLQFWL